MPFLDTEFYRLKNTRFAVFRYQRRRYENCLEENVQGSDTNFLVRLRCNYKDALDPCPKQTQRLIAAVEPALEMLKSDSSLDVERAVVLLKDYLQAFEKVNIVAKGYRKEEKDVTGKQLTTLD